MKILKRTHLKTNVLVVINHKKIAQKLSDFNKSALQAGRVIDFVSYRLLRGRLVCDVFLKSTTVSENVRFVSTVSLSRNV